jgi:phosphomannomutase
MDYNIRVNSIFKANDIRGIYPEELNEGIVGKIGSALCGYFGKNATLVVGHDARLSSPSLYRALIKGIMNNESGIRGKKKNAKIHNSRYIIQAGLMTTPMLYFLVSEYKTSGGIMITASHNPKQYNGLKVVKAGAKPVSGSEIGKIMAKFRVRK